MTYGVKIQEVRNDFVTHKVEWGPLLTHWYKPGRIQRVYLMHWCKRGLADTTTALLALFCKCPAKKITLVPGRSVGVIREYFADFSVNSCKFCSGLIVDW